MNIVFVYSLNDVQSQKTPLRNQEQMQFGISYISSFLKKHNHQTRLIVLSKVFGSTYKSIIDKCVEEFRPAVFCFTAVSSEYDFIASIAKYIKGKYLSIYLIIGGCHASLNPEGILSDAFDSLCVGEGEMPILELITQLENGLQPSNIPNLWIKHNDVLEKNPPRQFLQDLDSLPFPDRDMWQPWIRERSGTGVSILLGRGCPFECTYCCNHALKRIQVGAYVRPRSTGNIIEELKGIEVLFPGKRQVYFEVESLGVNVSWAIELCDKLANLNAAFMEPFSFGVNLRVAPGINYKALFAALKKANFKYVNIGLESGSERVRREILNRNYSNADIESAVKFARESGLKVNFFNMIGIPGETLADFKETVRINRACLPDRHMTSIFFPYPGTKLYSFCKEKGLVKDKLKTDMERSEATLDLPGFGRRQIQKSYYWFDYYVYRGHKPLTELLVRVIIVKLHSKPRINMLFLQLLRLPLLKRLKQALVS
jgi:radical SAM superfamily enzyme YgiQ (UPF0313 family)